MIVAVLYLSADSRLWRRDEKPEQITVFVTFIGKALKWWSSVALFVKDITPAYFCRISQHQQVYSFTTEYQRASLRILPTENYNLPFMWSKIPFLSSLLVTCHQSSRLYGVHTAIYLFKAKNNTSRETEHLIDYVQYTPNKKETHTIM